MAEITKEQAVQLAREAACPEGFIGSLILEQPHVAWIRALSETAYKLGRDAGLDDAAQLARMTVCDTHMPTGIKIYGSRAATAIESLKDNT